MQIPQNVPDNNRRFAALPAQYSAACDRRLSLFGVSCRGNSPNSVSTLRGSYGKRRGLGATLSCPLWPRAFCVVFAADSCSCMMSKCVSTGLAQNELATSVRERFAWYLPEILAQSEVSASVSRGIYRRLLLLLDVEVAQTRFWFLLFWRLRGPWGFVSWSGGTGFRRKVPGSIPALSARACFPFFGHAWMVLLCCDGVSMVL